MDIIDICAICGINQKMSFEHFPPKSAGNKKPVLIQDHRHHPSINPNLSGKYSKSGKGLGDYKLCESCNNNTGDWCSRDYAKIANEFTEVLENQSSSKFINHSINIKPLNFLKQVIIFLLCADQAQGILRHYIKETNFILDKKSQNLPSNIEIYMYTTNSQMHRYIGIVTQYFSPYNRILNLGEFNFHPFGFLILFDSKFPFYDMKSITEFKKYNYNEEIKIDFKLPLLNIKTTFPGEYH